MTPQEERAYWARRMADGLRPYRFQVHRDVEPDATPWNAAEIVSYLKVGGLTFLPENDRPSVIFPVYGARQVPRDLVRLMVVEHDDQKCLDAFLAWEQEQRAAFWAKAPLCGPDCEICGEEEPATPPKPR